MFQICIATSTRSIIHFIHELLRYIEGELERVNL